jgi:hypothetical protein
MIYHILVLCANTGVCVCVCVCVCVYIYVCCMCVREMGRKWKSYDIYQELEELMLTSRDKSSFIFDRKGRFLYYKPSHPDHQTYMLPPVSCVWYPSSTPCLFENEDGTYLITYLLNYLLT